MQRFVFALRAGFGAALALLVALIAALSAAKAGGILEGKNKRISDAGAAGATLARARIAEHNSALYAVWEDDRDGGAGPGAPPEIYYTVEGLGDYDLPATGSHYAAIVTRDFGVAYPPGFCLVHEPTYGRPGQTLYTSQYEYGLETALSADRRWMVYRTLGFCHPGASDVYSISRLCFVDLASSGEDREHCLGDYDYRTGPCCRADRLTSRMIPAWGRP